jgi:hypothetical protein
MVSPSKHALPKSITLRFGFSLLTVHHLRQYLRFEEDVFRLEIAMNEFGFFHNFQCIKYLGDDESGKVQGETLKHVLL